MATLELKNVSFQYENQTGSFEALRDVSLFIPAGQFLCVLGRSGCGKSTLLRLLAGLSKPTAGQVLLNGAQMKGPDVDRAVVFQSYALFPWMKALENVAFGIRQAKKELSKKEARERAADFLRQVDMIDQRDKYPEQLSGGQQQRVAIARALAMDTEILLLDEPFGALDERTRRELQSLLEQLWQESEQRKTVVFVTHDLEEASLLADRVVFMSPGRIEADIPVTLPRRRRELSPAEALELGRLRKGLLGLFYQNGGVEDA